MTEILAQSDRPLPVGSIGYMSAGWAAALFLLISEASIFAYLFFAYFYFSVQPDYQWPPGSPPSFAFSAPQTAIVMIGAATSWWAARLANRGAMARERAATRRRHDLAVTHDAPTVRVAHDAGAVVDADEHRVGGQQIDGAVPDVVGAIRVMHEHRRVLHQAEADGVGTAARVDHRIAQHRRTGARRREQKGDRRVRERFAHSPQNLHNGIVPASHPNAIDRPVTLDDATGNAGLSVRSR